MKPASNSASRARAAHQAPARDGHGSRVARALPGDEQRGFRPFLQAPQIPAPHPRVARVGGLRQTVQPAAQPGVGARLGDGPALVLPEGDARRIPFLGGIGRKLLPRLQPALLRDRAQHRREKIGHGADIAQRRALMRRAMQPTARLPTFVCNAHPLPVPMPIRVYADTSVYGGVFDPGIDAPRGEFFAQVKTGRFQLVVSPVVVDELQEAPERVRQVYEEHLPWAEFIDVSVEAVRLRDGYLQGRHRHAEMGHRRPPRRPRQRGTLPLHCQLELQAHRPLRQNPAVSWSQSDHRF